MTIQGISCGHVFKISSNGLFHVKECDTIAFGASYQFVPLAVDSFGRLGKEAARFLDDVGDVAAADSCASKDTFVRIVRQELSCALCRGDARMYDNSRISVARGVGFSLGLDRAVDEAGDVYRM